jgi:hypothetical protein
MVQSALHPELLPAGKLQAFVWLFHEQFSVLELHAVCVMQRLQSVSQERALHVFVPLP